MTARLDPDTVREFVEAQFPQLASASVTHLGEGCDSTTFDVNGRWVFRFPKRSDVEAQLVIEMRVLPVVAERSPIPVPAYRFHGCPTAAFPRHFGGYPRLPGVPGLQLGSDWRPSPAATATLGQFLSTLHAFPIDEAARLGVPEEPIETVLRELRAEALDGLAAVSRVDPDAPVDAWRAYLSAELPVADAAQPRRSVVHNDLAAEHILCDPVTGTVTGVIDWSDIAIGDPAADFAGMFHWGGQELVNRVLAHYDGQVDDAFVARARFIAACRGVADVTFGLEIDRREYVEGGLRALRLCASS